MAETKNIDREIRELCEPHLQELAVLMDGKWCIGTGDHMLLDAVVEELCRLRRKCGEPCELDPH